MLFYFKESFLGFITFEQYFVIHLIIGGYKIITLPQRLSLNSKITLNESNLLFVDDFTKILFTSELGWKTFQWEVNGFKLELIFFSQVQIFFNLI
jgi:hypothetical protein